MNKIQNAGAYSTENNADLTFIYEDIFGQLNYAAQQIPGQPFLTTTLVPGFEIVAGSIQTSKGNASVNGAGNLLSWFVPQVATESIYLKYTIAPIDSSVCGTQNPGDTEVKYLNADCEVVTQNIESPDICVPCPTLTAEISRQDCSRFIDYEGTFTNGSCGNFVAEFEWKFFLNNVQVGTSNTLTGTYEYTGTDPFEGTFTAQLAFIGSASGGCTIPGINAEDSIELLSAPDAPTSTGDITECEKNPIQTLNANDAIVPVTGQTIVWYSALTGGTVVNDPILNSVGSITYYAAAVVNGQCGSSERTPVKLTIKPAPNAPVSTGDIEECATNPLQTLNANDAITPVPGQTVVWYDASTDGNVINEPILHSIGSVTFYAEAYNTTSTCSSLTRTAVKLSIYALPDAPLSGGDQTECASDPIQTLTATATVPNGQTVIWYDAATGGNVVNPILDTIGTETYYAEANNTTTGCKSAARTAVTLTLNNCAISIEKTASPNNPQGCTPLAPGESISYNFTVTNEGNAPIINVVVNDALIDPINPISGPAEGDLNSNNILDVGEIWIYNASYSVTQQNIIDGQVENTAEVMGTVTGTSSNYTVTDSDSVTVALCQNAEISIVKASDSATGQCIPFNVDDTIDYTFTVTNDGDLAITDVVVTDSKLGGTIAGPADGDINGNNILDVGEVWLYEATYTVTQADIDAGSVVNIAEVNGNTALTTVEATSNSVTVLVCQTTPSLSVIKSQTSAAGGLGDVITYDIVVTNTGNTTISNIEIADANAVITAGNPIATLAPGSSATVTAEHQITQADLDQGYVENIAIATGDSTNGTDDVTDVSDTGTDTSGNTITDPETVETPDGEGNTNGDPTDDPTVTALQQSASISVIKSQTSAAGGLGDVITYDIVVTNTGNTTISNIEIADANAVITAGNPIATLAPGSSATVTAEHQITQADLDQGYVENIAIATGDSTNGTDDVTDVSDTGTDTSGNTITDPETVETPDGEGNTNGDPTDDPTVTALQQSASISVIKSQTSAAGGLGDVITYDIVVTNTGNTTISNIEITDANAVITAGNPIATLAPGSSATVTAEHQITQADLDQGYVENIAIATGDSTNGTDDVTDVSDTGTDTSGNTITDPETVETPDGEGNTNGDPTDDPTVTVLQQSPAIAIVKTAVYDDGGDCSQPGEIIEYTFNVTNEGNVSLSSITVEDPLLGGLIAGPDSGDTDGDNQLDVTETWVYTASYTITQEDINTGKVKNQATATGVAPDQSSVSDLSGSTTTTDDTTITPLCQDGKIAIVKTAIYDDGGDCTQPGEMIDYTFTLTNEGNVLLSSIEVNDPLLGGPIAGPDSGDINSDGKLDIGESWIYTGSYTITQEDIDAGEVVNQATAKGQTPAGGVVSDLSGSTISTDDQTITGLCQNANIAVVKTGVYDDGGDCSQPGEMIDYTFTVTNQGNVTLSNIVLTDPLLATITGPTGDTDADGNLDVTETWTYTGSYAITQEDIEAGEVTNQATVTGTAPDQSMVTDLSGSTISTDDATITPLCQNPAIAVVKTSSYDDGGDCSQPGEMVDYTFTVTNEGNVSLSNIVLDDPLLGGTIAGPDSGDANGDGILNLGEAWVYTGNYAITQQDIDNGEVVNQATVTGTAPDQSNVSDLSGSTTTTNDPTITTLCSGASIALIKVGTVNDTNGNGCGDVGETIQYSFSIKNTGNLELDNITVNDPLVSVTGGPISLASGAIDTSSFTAVYTITQADIDAGIVENQATVEGTDPNGNMVTDLSDDDSYTENDPTITGLCQTSSIALEKTGVFMDENGNGASDEGETIEYNFKVTNTGNVTLYNITITDPLPGIQIIGGPIPVLEPGQSDSTTFTAVYSITLQDIDNLQVVNQATVTGEDINGNLVTDLSDDPTDLTNIDVDGDGDPDDPTVVILPDVLGVSTFEIYNGVTPNGDGANDFFMIEGISAYPNNNVKIYNRWGVLVFETDGYGGSNDEQNVFRGISEGRVTVQKNEKLPTGTYYYILTFPASNPGKQSYSGYLYINR